MNLKRRVLAALIDKHKQHDYRIPRAVLSEPISMSYPALVDEDAALPEVDVIMGLSHGQEAHMGRSLGQEGMAGADPALPPPEVEPWS